MFDLKWNERIKWTKRVCILCSEPNWCCGKVFSIFLFPFSYYFFILEKNNWLRKVGLVLVYKYCWEKILQKNLNFGIFCWLYPILFGIRGNWIQTQACIHFIHFIFIFFSPYKTVWNGNCSLVELDACINYFPWIYGCRLNGNNTVAAAIRCKQIHVSEFMLEHIWNNEEHERSIEKQRQFLKYVILFLYRRNVWMERRRFLINEIDNQANVGSCMLCDEMRTMKFFRWWAGRLRWGRKRK